MPTTHPSAASASVQRNDVDTSPSSLRPSPLCPSSPCHVPCQASPPPLPLPPQQPISQNYRATGPLSSPIDSKPLNAFPVVHATQLGWTPRTPVDNTRRPHQSLPSKKKSQQLHLPPSASSESFVYHAPRRDSPASGKALSPAPPSETAAGTRASGAPNNAVAQAPHAQTPAWLKGAYTPRASTPNVSSSSTGKSPVIPAPVTSPSGQNYEIWCKQRTEAIISTICGGDAIPELRQIVERLDHPFFDKQNAALRVIRKEKWTAKARARKSFVDLDKAQKDLMKINAQLSHVDAKIARLRSYTEFIDCGWRENVTTDDYAAQSPCKVATANSKAGKSCIVLPNNERQIGVVAVNRGSSEATKKDQSVGNP